MIMTQSSLFVVNNMKSGSAHGLRSEEENRNPGPSLTILFFLRWQTWRGYVEQRKANDLFKRRSRFHGRCLAIYTAIPSSKRSKPKVKLSPGAVFTFREIAREMRMVAVPRLHAGITTEPHALSGRQGIGLHYDADALRTRNIGELWRPKVGHA